MNPVPNHPKIEKCQIEKKIEKISIKEKRQGENRLVEKGANIIRKTDGQGERIKPTKNFKISKPKIEKQTSKKKPKIVQKNTLLSYYSFKHKIKTDSSENSASIQEKHKLVQVKTNVDLKKADLTVR